MLRVFSHFNIPGTKRYTGIQAITIASSFAILEQARHGTSRLDTTRQDKSCRVVSSQVEFGSTTFANVLVSTAGLPNFVLARYPSVS